MNVLGFLGLGMLSIGMALGSSSDSKASLQSAYLIRAGACVSSGRPLQSHFDRVIEILEEQREAGLELALTRLEKSRTQVWTTSERSQWYRKLQLERNRQVLVLRQYRDRGRFPLNEHSAGAIPIFVDQHHTACAVGYLMRRSGAESFVSAIAHSQNNVYVSDVQEGKLFDWILTSGLTQEEAALIQPGYPLAQPSKPLTEMLEGEDFSVGGMRHGEFQLLKEPEWSSLDRKENDWSRLSATVGRGTDRFYASLSSENVSHWLNVGEWRSFVSPQWIQGEGFIAEKHTLSYSMTSEIIDADKQLRGMGLNVSNNFIQFPAGKENGRFRVQTEVYDAKYGRLLGTITLDSDTLEKEAFANGYVMADSRVAFEPVTAVRAVSTIEIWGKVGLSGLFYEFESSRAPAPRLPMEVQFRGTRQGTLTVNSKEGYSYTLKRSFDLREQFAEDIAFELGDGGPLSLSFDDSQSPGENLESYFWVVESPFSFSDLEGERVEIDLEEFGRLP